MDIVSRIKQFISYLDIPVTQFADSCNIPRPTLSQLLNGRNKKVSDEFLRKLHIQYPNLNIVWLLYGEGNMLNEENMQFSSRQTSLNFSDDDSQSPDFQQKENTADKHTGFEKMLPNKQKEANPPEITLPQSDSLNHDQILDQKKAIKSLETISNTKQDSNQDTNKKIVNIIVYYSDNSFESFIPEGNK